VLFTFFGGSELPATLGGVCKTEVTCVVAGDVIIFPISILFWGYLRDTIFLPPYFFLPTNMVSSATKERQWRGRPAATRLVHTVATRVQMVPTPRLHTQKPTGKLATGGWAHQNTSKTVFDFVSQPTLRCCKQKQCMSHFLSADDPRVTAARAPLYDVNLMRAAWCEHLVIEFTSQAAANKIFVVARSTLALSA
jgi:hypothetical protein